MPFNIGDISKLPMMRVGGLPLMYEKVGLNGSRITFNEPLRKALYLGAGAVGALGVMKSALTYQDPATRVFDMAEPDTSRGRHGANYAMNLHYNNR